MQFGLSRFWISFFVTVAFAPLAVYAEPVPLDGIDHVHGLTVDKSNPDRLLLATHHGLFAATENGLAVRVSKLNADFMSFAEDPLIPGKLYASGHPAQGGNLGVMISQDGGVVWENLSQGDGGPVDFHALSVSPVDSRILYGIHEGLQLSRDGGKVWQRIADAPKRTFALAASAKDVDTVYAATMQGLLVSRDSGRNWEEAYFLKRPATMVHIAADGRMYAFIYGVGLVSAEEPSFAWTTISEVFQDRALMSLSVHPQDKSRLFAVTDTNAIMISKDGGKSWFSFEGNQRQTAEGIAAGAKLYAENCQACHGAKGVGERPDNPNAQDEYGFVAPALNDDAHGWHHPDAQLVETILNGSPRNERMIAWKESLSREDAESLVIYIKSLWSFRSLACQGTRHMACMR